MKDFSRSNKGKKLQNHIVICISKPNTNLKRKICQQLKESSVLLKENLALSRELSFEAILIKLF